MVQPFVGNVAPMEETPICASVERDLDLSVDELVTPATPAPAASDTAKPTPA